MKYFSFSEFERSETGTRYAIDNRMPEPAKKNVAALVDNVLDPLREAWGHPIQVTSGYRNGELNRLVGGVATSQHTVGEAADITTGNKVDNARLFQLAIDMKLPFDQLIDEKGFSWIHVSHKRGGVNRGQILKL
ncbi:MAG: peptidase M15 [Bacteroides sp.]|nr:peptidase M15 [Bacteroides sp.]